MFKSGSLPMPELLPLNQEPPDHEDMFSAIGYNGTIPWRHGFGTTKDGHYRNG
jgi:hypothetical protein